MLQQGGNIIDDYYDTKIKEIELKVKAKQINFMRLQAQRNDLNEKVIKIREELRHLLKPRNEVGEVIKILGKDKVLIKTSSDGKYIVKVDSKINIEDLRPNLRVTIGEGKKINRILPNRVDPLVSLMRVEKVPDATYDMVGGLDKQINEIREVIELPIKHPEVFESLGISQPKGVLMYGPPGTGKTLLAKACAHHTDCCFIRVSGNELVQKYIGEGARLVRELFIMARQHAPSIIFMDEIDSIGGHRISNDSKGDSEVQSTML